MVVSTLVCVRFAGLVVCIIDEWSIWLVRARGTWSKVRREEMLCMRGLLIATFQLTVLIPFEVRGPSSSFRAPTLANRQRWEPNQGQTRQDSTSDWASLLSPQPQTLELLDSVLPGLQDSNQEPSVLTLSSYFLPLLLSLRQSSLLPFDDRFVA